MNKTAWKDPIVEEVRKARQENARRFKFDLAAIVRDVQDRQKIAGPTVDRSTKATRSKRSARRPLRRAVRIAKAKRSQSKSTKAARR